MILRGQSAEDTGVQGLHPHHASLTDAREPKPSDSSTDDEDDGGRRQPGNKDAGLEYHDVDEEDPLEGIIVVKLALGELRHAGSEATIGSSR